MYRFALPKRPRRWQHGAVLTFALLFTLLGLAPLRGGDIELKVPVSYCRVKLPARAPTLVSLDLPAGEYQVAPPSLGYFNSRNEFVYTADEPRGLIYARSGEKVIVLELQAPARSEEFVTDYLQRIRDAVKQLNQRKNELLQTRQRFAKASARPKQLAAIPLGMNSLDLAQGFEDWRLRAESEGQGILTKTQSALADSSAERNEIKRLHYESEKADIELALRSFDLQIALARLPKPLFASVLGGGDGARVQALTLRDLETRRDTYSRRRSELQLQQQMDMQWLAGGKGKPASPLALMEGSVPVLVPASPALPQPLDTGLRESVQQARLSLSSAEVSYIDSALEEVTAAIKYVKRGGVLDGAELPRVAVARAQFTPVRVSDLDNLTVVETSTLQPGPASNILLELAQSFEVPESPQPLQLNVSGGAMDVNCFPSEVWYGLLIVDRNHRIETRSEGMPDSEALISKLTKMLASPAEHGAAENDLGYLQFILWYAGHAEVNAESLAASLEAASDRVSETSPSSK